MFLAPLVMLTCQRGKSALCLFLFFVFAHSVEECDKFKCKGPLRFYEELQCKPVYANPGDCCAVRYDCSHLSTREPFIYCYANGHRYDLLAKLNASDYKNPCEFACTCTFDAKFYCQIAERTLPQLPREDCYYRYQRGTCYEADVICPKEGEERPKCEVDGKTVLDGQDFYPQSRQDLACECRPDFKGELVEPFCWKIPCKFEELHTYDIYTNSSPVYYAGRSPQMTCTSKFKRPYNTDTIIPASNNSTAVEKVSDDFKCKYGNTLLNIGDKVTSVDSFANECISCECEVPPTATCILTPCNSDQTPD